MRVSSVTIVVVVLLMLPSLQSAEPHVVDVWPGAPAGDIAASVGQERWYESNSTKVPWIKRVTNVTRPTLTVYHAETNSDQGRTAVIICPGGGYTALSWIVEGEQVAKWLNSLGVTGIILKYRCPRRPGDPPGIPAPGPLKDAQRAVSLVRSRAAEWNIDPSRIGMIGFSAGGHLVGATATNFAMRSYAPIDPVDRVSCRPDFGIMAYSGYFYLIDEDRLSPTISIVNDAPPLFFVHASDDPVKGSEVVNSVMFYLALRKAGHHPELHVYATGGHGFGVRHDGGPCASWTDRCVEWLKRSSMLTDP